MKHWCGLVYFCCFVQLSWAQVLGGNFQSFTDRQGLSDKRIFSIAQDRMGFLWVGTANGLNRYDGYTFRQFFPKKGDSTSLPGSMINRLLVDSHSDLWVATDQGICRLQRKGYFFQRFNTVQPKGDARDASILDFFPAPDGNLWMITRAQNLLILNPVSRQIKKIDLPLPNEPFASDLQRYQATNAFDVWINTDGVVWIGGRNGFYRSDLQTKDFEYYPMPEVDNVGVQYIRQTEPGYVWVMVWQKGIYRYDLQNRTYKKIENPQGLPFSNLWLEKNGDLSLGSGFGLTRLNIAKEQRSDLPWPTDFRSGISVTALCRDRGGILWIGTETGLIKNDPHLQGFELVKMPQPQKNLYRNDLDDLWAAPDGQFILLSGVQNRILCLNNQGQVLRSKTLNGPLKPTRYLQDRQKRCWIACQDVLMAFNPNTLDHQLMARISEANPSNTSVGLAQDQSGRIWWATSHDGLWSFEPKTRKLKPHQPNKVSKVARILRMLLDEKGQYLWLSTDGEGFWELDIKRNTWQQYTDRVCDGLSSCRGLIQDLNGQVWISSLAGLLQYSPQTKHCRVALSRETGLPLNLLDGGIRGPKGELWWGMNDRLLQLDPTTLRFKIYDERHAASHTPFGYLQFAKSADGKELYACAYGGFVRWRPLNLSNNKIPPQVVNTRLLLTNKVVYPTTDSVTKLGIRPAENSFTLEMAALNFTLPEENQYQWKLQGFDEQWSKAGKDRFIRYTFLPPGRYQLFVRAANNDGLWQKKAQVFQVFIQAAWWQTVWFRTLILTLILGLAYGIYRWRLKQVRERERLELDFKRRLDEVEMSALRAQMNPHFIFNCLNSINSFILRNQPIEASAYLSKFSRLIRLVLDNSKSEVISLEKELETLELYIGMEAHRFEGRFKYQIMVDETLDPGSIDIPPMLIQPYIENAIWHGLLHRKGNDGLLTLTLKKQNELMEIRIRDNGIGRKAAQELKSKSATERKSHGMALTAERLQILRERFGHDIKVDIQDLLDENNSPLGTEVLLTFSIK
jgi:ligand-binding sensor domain-containing protein